MSDIEKQQRQQQLRDFRGEFLSLCDVVQEITGEPIDLSVTAEMAYPRARTLFADHEKLRRVREVFHRLEVLFGPFNDERAKLFGPGPQ